MLRRPGSIHEYIDDVIAVSKDKTTDVSYASVDFSFRKTSASSPSPDKHSQGSPSFDSSVTTPSPNRREEDRVRRSRDDEKKECWGKAKKICWECGRLVESRTSAPS